MRLSLFLLSALLLAAALSGCEQPQQSQIKPSSAGLTVSVLAGPLPWPSAEQPRNLRIYLPPSYASSQQSYPVLYMHDGQNLFDDATSYVGEWGVDETLDALAESHGLALIVVGIDHGDDQRLVELSPWTNPEFGEARGEDYAEFVVNQVKPYIDGHYRTLSDPQNTAIMGSSMGGLMSHYLIHQYPDVFSKAGIFSPSYWYSEQVYSHTQQHPLPIESRLFMLVGAKEGENMVTDFQRMTSLLEDHSEAQQISIIDDEGEHNEGFWRAYLARALLFLFEPNQ